MRVLNSTTWKFLGYYEGNFFFLDDKKPQKTVLYCKETKYILTKDLVVFMSIGDARRPKYELSYASEKRILGNPQLRKVADQFMAYVTNARLSGMPLAY